MKILHTSDIHLREPGDARWQALETIVQVANEQKVEALIISGDLFDDVGAYQRLASPLRSLFNAARCPVLIIPGNHDAAAFPEGVYLGDSVHFFEHREQPFRIEEVDFWGIPFQRMNEEAILHLLYQLGQKVDAERENILILHGELLDVSGIWQEYGEEGESRYFPIKLKYFQGLPFSYVLAGHFHTRFAVHRIPEGGFFVYPGSPVSVTRREVGRRKANLLEVGQPPQELELDTQYYEEWNIVLDPIGGENPLQLLEEKKRQLPPFARVILHIHGFFDREKIGKTESELQKEIKEFLGDLLANEPEDEPFLAHDVHDILEDNLYRTFVEKLEGRNFSAEEKRLIKELTLRAMGEAGR